MNASISAELEGGGRIRKLHDALAIFGPKNLRRDYRAVPLGEDNKLRSAVIAHRSSTSKRGRSTPALDRILPASTSCDVAAAPLTPLTLRHIRYYSKPITLGPEFSP